MTDNVIKIRSSWQRNKSDKDVMVCEHTDKYQPEKIYTPTPEEIAHKDYLLSELNKILSGSSPDLQNKRIEKHLENKSKL